MKAIVHLSDLHLSVNKKFGFNVDEIDNLIEKLVSDIKSIETKDNFKIDSIFFTGDLTFSGQDDEFEDFHHKFLLPLLGQLEISMENVFITPGNHDMNRKCIGIIEKGIREKYEADAISEIFSNIDAKNETWPRADSYTKYISKYHQNHTIEHNGHLCRVHKISNKLYILSLNSAWLAQNDEDESNLKITKSQIKIIEKIKFARDAKIIALTHHPLDWLENGDRDHFSTFIEKKVSMLCFGHMHNFKQKQESNFCEGITLFLQAGTLDLRERQCGYSIILFNNPNSVDDGRIIYRKYDKESECFSPWNERGNNGEFSYSTNTMISFDLTKFASTSERLLEDYDTDLLINIGTAEERKKRLSQLFTEPNYIEMESIPIQNSDFKNTQEIVDGNSNIAIFGSHNSGKTSLLKYIFIMGLKKQSHKEVDNIYFYLDFSSSEFSNYHRLFNLLCNIYFSTDASTSFEEKIKSALLNGHCTILFDNISSLKKEKLEIVLDFMRTHSNCKFIFSCDKSKAYDLSSILIDNTIPEFRATSIGTLKRCNVRDIVSRWSFTFPYTGENKLYNEITKTINNSQLPHNYFIYSMLLAIYEADNEIRGILTESDIIENFIEILLKKHIMDTPSDKPQYKELLHFLGFLGKTCFQTEKNFFSNNELLEIAMKFNKMTIATYNIQDYIDPLIISGILIKKNNNITFSQPSFLHYAISYFMGHDSQLHSDVLSEKNYLKLDKAVEYYASQNASSLALLELLRVRTQKIISQMSSIIEKEKNINIDTMDIDKINRVSFLTLVSSQEDFEAKVEELKSDRDSDDERLDKVSPLQSEEDNCDQKMEKTLKKDDSIKYLPSKLLENLSLYSRVFRSTELTMDPEKTIDIFDNITNGFIFYMKTFILSMDEQYVIPYMLPIIEKKMTEDNLTEKQKSKVIETFKTILLVFRSAMPNTVQSIMSDVISSKKPRIENIIKETKKQNSADKIKTTILGLLLMDLKDDNIQPIVSELIKIKNNSIQDSLFLKINQIIMGNYDLNKKDEEFLKTTLKGMAKKKKLTELPKLGDAMQAMREN